MLYNKKYLKYKNKYLNNKILIGGDEITIRKGLSGTIISKLSITDDDDDDMKKLETQIEQCKTQIEQSKTQIEQFKTQIEQYKTQIEQCTTQMKTNNGLLLDYYERYKELKESQYHKNQIPLTDLFQHINKPVNEEYRIVSGGEILTTTEGYIDRDKIIGNEITLIQITNLLTILEFFIPSKNLDRTVKTLKLSIKSLFISNTDYIIDSAKLILKPNGELYLLIIPSDNNNNSTLKKELSISLAKVADIYNSGELEGNRMKITSINIKFKHNTKSQSIKDILNDEHIKNALQLIFISNY